MDLLNANDLPGQYPNSYYAATAKPLPLSPQAAGALHCDVCIVGGGFTGLSAAMHLAERGYDVVLLEAQRLGFGASGRNGGQVGRGQRVDQDRLEALLGITHARALWDLAGDAVALVRRLASAPDIDVPFHNGIIHADHRRRFVSETKAYVDKLNRDYNDDQIRFLNRDECRHLINSPAYYGGSLDLGSGHIHPLAFAFGLARRAQAAGARLFEQSCVLSLAPGDPAVVKTRQAVIHARYVLLGCNGYLGGLHPSVAARVMPINNYIIATAPLGAQVQEQLIRHNYAVADSKFVINYFRFSDDHRLLFGGTESYGYRFPQDIAGTVRRPLAQIFPQLRDVKIDYAWGGTLAITMNRMPHFQRFEDNILSCSGYSGHGVAMATLAGAIAAEAIAGQAERFDLLARVPTARFPGGATLRSPLLALAMLWYRLRDML